MYIAGLRAVCDLVNLMAFKTRSDLGIISFFLFPSASWSITERRLVVFLSCRYTIGPKKLQFLVRGRFVISSGVLVPTNVFSLTPAHPQFCESTQQRVNSCHKGGSLVIACWRQT